MRNDWLKWLEAMKAEMKSLDDHKTYTIVDVKPGDIVLPGKWVFTLKIKSDGSLEKYKARYVVLGNLQYVSSDTDLFAPVSRRDSLRILLTIGAALGWVMIQLDWSCAFLNGKLEVPVLVKIPDMGDGVSNHGKAMLVEGNLYGLKEAPKVWNTYLHGVLTKYGFTRAEKDQGIYFHSVKKVFIITYVDDMLVMGSDAEWIEEFKNDLMSNYKLTGGDEVDKFLGMTIVRDKAARQLTLYMPQIILDAAYDHNVVRAGEDGLTNRVNVKTPMLKVKLSNQGKPDESLRYREIVGVLGYIASTIRPDLAFAFHFLSKYQSCFRQEHYDVAKRVLKYAVATRDRGLVLGGHPMDPDGALTLKLYTDANWADDDDAKSVTGLLVLLNGRLVQWRSVKQRCVATSTFAAETYALSAGAQEVLGILNFLREIGFKVNTPIDAMVDNEAAVMVASTDSFNDKSRSLHIAGNLAKDLHREGILAVKHIPGSTQKADGLTKMLGPTKFTGFIDGLSMLEEI